MMQKQQIPVAEKSRKQDALAKSSYSIVRSIVREESVAKFSLEKSKRGLLVIK